MADSALSAVQALDVQRRRLVDEYVNRAWNMWRSLTPADWWNDAVTEGAAAYVTQQQIAFVKAMRRCGITYADIMLRLVMTQGSAYHSSGIVEDRYVRPVRGCGYEHVHSRRPDANA